MLVARGGRDKRDATLLGLDEGGLGRALQVRAGAGRGDPCRFHVPLGCSQALGAEIEAVVVGGRHQVEPGPGQILGDFRFGHHEGPDALPAREPCQLFQLGEVHLEVAIRDVGILHQVPDPREIPARHAWRTVCSPYIPPPGTPAIHRYASPPSPQDPGPRMRHAPRRCVRAVICRLPVSSVEAPSEPPSTRRYRRRRDITGFAITLSFMPFRHGDGRCRTSGGGTRIPMPLWHIR